MLNRMLYVCFVGEVMTFDEIQRKVMAWAMLRI